MTPRESFIPLDTGLRYHVLSFGDPAAEHTVLLIHGFLDLAWGWEETATRLAERYHVIAPDLRGHGDSDPVGPGGYYYIWDYMADLACLVDSLALPKETRLSLVGHSMGGSVAAYFAGTYPDRVYRLALLEGTGPPSDTSTTPERVPGWIASFRAARRPRPSRGYPDVAAAAEQLRRFDDRLDPALALRLAERSTRRGEDGALRFKHDPLHLTQGPLPYRREVALDFFRRVRCPVLLLEGADSRLRHPPEEAAVRHGAFADARLEVLPGAGHMMQRHQPAALAAALSAFLG